VSRARNLLLLLVLAVCAASFWWARRGPTGAGAPTGRSPRAAAVQPVAAAPLSAHVAVLNGTGESGLARRFSRRMADLGCVVVETADAPHDTFSRSLLVNRRLTDDEARRLAASLGGLPVLREWDPRRREDAVVVLGRDHARLQAAIAR
jgi:hypothetical protein